MTKDTEMQVDKESDSVLKGTHFIHIEITVTVSLLERAVSSLESRFATRALRGTSSYRHLLTGDILKKVIGDYVVDTDLKTLLATSIKASVETSTNATPVPEVEVFIGLLVVLYLLDQKSYDLGLKTAANLLERTRSLNRRTLDPIGARLFFFYAHFHDLSGKLDSTRAFLISSHRTAVLRQDNDTQATLVNLILKNYLALNLIDQADKFVSKALFPDTVGNNQLARYMYYLGRIKAIQLDYSSSHRYILQAIRKVPTSPNTIGFQQTTQKLSVIVQLLMGEIPERAIFHQETLSTALAPYLQITQAVRTGDLAKFQDTLNKHSDVFHADKNMNLILRLRHNVIKAGIRRISISYSRISLKDICHKLQLDSEEDAEYIVAKAIRDGVIDATLEHENGYMKSNETVDIYSTTEPQNTFHQRISFCLNLHNESVQALRFPHDAHKKALEKAAKLLEEERLAEKELLEKGIDDDDDGMDYQ